MTESKKKYQKNMANDVRYMIDEGLARWPCAVAVLEICAIYAFASWVNRPVEEQNSEAA